VRGAAGIPNVRRGDQVTHFGPFRLDTQDQCLWRDAVRIQLPPKLFSVLGHLVANAGRLITQNELLEAVWPETYVQPEVLRKYILELRKALGDDPKKPVYIETVPKRGYRFLAEVSTGDSTASSSASGAAGALGGNGSASSGSILSGAGSTAGAWRTPGPANASTPRAFGAGRSGGPGSEAVGGLPQTLPPPEAHGLADLVGRHLELSRLESLFELAAQGQRQLVFITGEAGIGKSTLVDALERRLRARPGVRIARGQCVEGFGGKEAYYPVLDAFSQLLRGPDSARVIEGLAQHAPAWLIQFPALLTPDQRESLRREILGATRERMVREIFQAMEALSAELPLVVILEDLHWVDPSTLDLLSAIARGRGNARLCIVGTYRPVEVILSQNPLKSLKQDLVVHRLCSEVALERLTERDVAMYLAREYPGADEVPGFARVLHQQSEGNPLFMSAILGDLLKEGVLSSQDGRWTVNAAPEDLVPAVPETLQQMIEAQLDRLSAAEQRALRSAAIAGTRFSAWTIASVLDAGLPETEEVCERLAQAQQFLRPRKSGTSLGSALSAQYEFRHSLYREALYRQIPSGQRALLHRKLAEKAQELLESAGREAQLEYASELALHFENARDFERAARYSILSAENAALRYAHRDAIHTLEHALTLVAGVPPRAAAALEIELLERISDAHYALGDMDRSAETDRRIIQIASERGMRAAHVGALTRLARALAFRDPNDCVVVCEQAVEMSRALEDPLLQARTEMLAACWRIVSDGWNRRDADICAGARRRIHDLRGLDLPAYYEILYAHVQSIQGNYEDSYEIARGGIEKAAETHSLVVYLSSLSSMAFALMHLGWWGQLRRTLENAIDLSLKNGNTPWRDIFQAMLAWLHMQSFEFGGARRIASELLETNTEEPAGQVRTMALLTIAYSDLTSGRADLALENFLRVRDREPKPKFFLQWYWRMISEFGVVGAYLEQGEIEKADSAARMFLEDALSTADPALQSPAWDGMARVSAARGDLEKAWEYTGNAFQAVENLGLPSMMWRVHHTASRLQLRMGNRGAAAAHSESAASALLEASRSFEASDPLRRSLERAAENLKADFQRQLEVARVAGAGDAAERG
jgi:DNA-binding winged helix-turn-helix (wHTH) protein